MTSNNALLVLQTFRTEAHPPSHVRAGHRHSGWSVRRRTATADPPTTAVFVLLFRIFLSFGNRQRSATVQLKSTMAESKPKKKNPFLAMSAGCIAGGIEATAVWPMEYIKVSGKLGNDAVLCHETTRFVTGAATVVLLGQMSNVLFGFGSGIIVAYR